MDAHDAAAAWAGIDAKMKNKWTLLAFLCATFVFYTIDRALIGALAIPILADIWRAHLSSDRDGRLAQGYAMYRLLIDQRNFPGKRGLRGYNLYMLCKAGVFKNLVSREYKTLNVTDGGNFGVGREWRLSTLEIPDRQTEELDLLYADMMRFERNGGTTW